MTRPKYNCAHLFGTRDCCICGKQNHYTMYLCGTQIDNFGILRYSQLQMSYSNVSNTGRVEGLGNISPRTIDIGRIIQSEPGSTYEEIAERYGVSRQRIGQIAKRFAVDRKRFIEAVAL